MFYPNDILTRRRNGFGLYWLAATIGVGSRHSFKSKLSKKEVIGCNIVEACQRLVAPDEPLALRLSSNLLCGISRIYQQQFTIHLSEVTLVHNAIKKSFTEIYRGLRKNDDIDLPAVGAIHPAGGINLVIDADLARIGRIEFDEDWDNPGLGLLPIMEEDEMGLESGMMDSSGIQSMGTPQIGRKALHQAKDDSINLYEPHMEHYVGLGGRTDDSNPFDQIPALAADDPGILMGMDDEIDAVIRESSQGSKGGWNAGGRVSSSNGAGGPIDMGGMDDFIFDDFGGGDERRVGETLEEKVEREKHEASLQRADGSFVRRESSFGLLDPNDDDATSKNSSRKSKRPAGPDDEAEFRAPRKVAKKPKQNIVDRDINLSDEQLNSNKSSYTKRMEQAKAAADMVKFEKAESARALEMVFGAPAGFAPELAKFWNDNVNLKPFPSNVTSKRKRPIENEDADETETGRKKMREDDFDPFGIHGLPNEDYGGGDDYGFGLPNDVEQARAASINQVAASQRESIMPWNIAAGTSDGAGDIGAGFASSQAGSGKASIDSLPREEQMRRSKSHSQSRLDSASPEQRIISDELVRLSGNEVDFEDFGGEGNYDSFEKSKALATLEKDSYNFLAYTQRKQAELESENLFFSDLAPVGSTINKVAAQALYHLLSLATKELVRVEQTESFGEILIEIVE